MNWYSIKRKFGGPKMPLFIQEHSETEAMHSALWVMAPQANCVTKPFEDHWEATVTHGEWVDTFVIRRENPNL